MLQSMFELAREYDLPIRLPIAHGTAKSIDGLPEELIPPMLEFAPQILEQFQPRSLRLSLLPSTMKTPPAESSCGF